MPVVPQMHLGCRARPGRNEVSVEAQSFKTARQSLDAAPFSKWLAILASIVSIVAFLLLLPLIYLFVDLLVWRGAIPTYATLTAARVSSINNKRCNFLRVWQEFHCVVSINSKVIASSTQRKPLRRFRHLMP